MIYDPSEGVVVMPIHEESYFAEPVGEYLTVRPMRGSKDSHYPRPIVAILQP